MGYFRVLNTRMQIFCRIKIVNVNRSLSCFIFTQNAPIPNPGIRWFSFDPIPSILWMTYPKASTVILTLKKNLAITRHFCFIQVQLHHCRAIRTCDRSSIPFNNQTMRKKHDQKTRCRFPRRCLHGGLLLRHSNTPHVLPCLFRLYTALVRAQAICSHVSCWSFNAPFNDQTADGRIWFKHTFCLLNGLSVCISPIPYRLQYKWL